MVQLENMPGKNIVRDEIFEERTMEAKFIFKISEKWEGYRRKQTPSYIGKSVHVPA
jgi:hypothetical protein